MKTVYIENIGVLETLKELLTPHIKIVTLEEIDKDTIILKTRFDKKIFNTNLVRLDKDTYFTLLGIDLSLGDSFDYELHKKFLSIYELISYSSSNYLEDFNKDFEIYLFSNLKNGFNIHTSLIILSLLANLKDIGLENELNDLEKKFVSRVIDYNTDYITYMMTGKSNLKGDDDVNSL